MAHRTFTDEHGTEWQVWDVTPQVLGEAEDRRRTVRRVAVGRHPHPDRRTITDRRHRPDRRAKVRLIVSRELAAGWLAFESPTERRRLAPVPGGWDAAPEDELRRLCALAAPVAPRRP